MRGATVGLSDVGLAKSGVMTPEEIKEYKEESPWASGLGEVGGIAGSLLIPGGGLVGQVAKAGAKVAQPLAKVPALGKLAAATTEGAAIGGAFGASEAVWDPDKGAADVLRHAAWGGAVGAGFGAIGLGASSLGKFASKRLQKTEPSLAERSLKDQELGATRTTLDNVKKELNELDEVLTKPGGMPARTLKEVDKDLVTLEKSRQKLAYEFDRYKYRRDATYKKIEGQGKTPELGQKVDELADWQRRADLEFRALDKRQQKLKAERDSIEEHGKRVAIREDHEAFSNLQAKRAQLHGEREALEKRVVELGGATAGAKSTLAEKLGGSVLSRIIAGSVGGAIGGPVGAAAGWIVAPKIADAVLRTVGGRGAAIRVGGVISGAAKKTGAALGKVGRPAKLAAITMSSHEFAELRDEMESIDPGQLEAEMHLAFPHNIDPNIKQKVIDQAMGRVMLVKQRVEELAGPRGLGKRRAPAQDKLDGLARWIRPAVDTNWPYEALSKWRLSKEDIEVASQLDPEPLEGMRRVVASQLWRRQHNTVKQERQLATFLGQPEIRSRLFQPHTALGLANLIGSQPPPPKAAGRPSRLSQQHVSALEGAQSRMG
jgi:hypothetical protein